LHADVRVDQGQGQGPRYRISMFFEHAKSCSFFKVRDNVLRPSIRLIRDTWHRILGRRNKEPMNGCLLSSRWRIPLDNVNKSKRVRHLPLPRRTVVNCMKCLRQPQLPDPMASPATQLAISSPNIRLTCHPSTNPRPEKNSSPTSATK
jgi:hypothetical protein